MESRVKSRPPQWVRLTLVIGLLLAAPPAKAQHDLLRPYEDGTRSFREVEIGEKMRVYYHLRTIGEATVEKDFIVYQFDKHTGELLAKKSHWRDNQQEVLPPDLISENEATARVGGEIQWTRLWILSPDSDVFPIEPTPENPCWVVSSVDEGAWVVTVIDATNGHVLGNGIPPPYGAFSMSGPHYTQPCRGAWTEWYQNAAMWFNLMGYETDVVEWPGLDHIRGHVQSNTTTLVYIVAHGNPLGFSSGCLSGDFFEYLLASDVEEWIADYPKVPFAFLGGCDALCSTGYGTISDSFRKGSMDGTVSVGYCGISAGGCVDAWVHSVVWQDALLRYLQSGLTMQEAFDLAGADYPMCVATGCMLFVGDPDLTVSPPVSRTGIMYVVDPFGTGDFETIQAAIDSLSDGDFIVLTEGTYTGPGNRDIDFRGKTMYLQSLTGDAAECVIDCEGLGRAFFFPRGSGGQPAIYGITITDGHAWGNPPYDRGGAVCCRGSSPVFGACSFLGNEAVGDGGAVHCDSSSLTLVGCLLENNTSGGSGGGLSVAGESQLTVMECTLGANVAFIQGGAIAAAYPADLTLSGCTIEGNCATSRAPFARGGGIFLGADATVEGCTVVGNRSTAEGGGICISSDDPVELSFKTCTIAGNYAETHGGGVSCEGMADAFFERTIVWGNGAVGAGAEVYVDTPAAVQFACSDVDSSGIDGTGLVDWLWYNIHLDPGFCNPADAFVTPTTEGDYHLKDASPAAEGSGTSFCERVGALDVGCAREVFLVSADGTGGCATIQAAIDSAQSYDIIELGDGIFAGPGNRGIDFRGKSCVVRSQSGTAEASMIDCEGQERAFHFHSGETCSTRVENVTVRDGHATEGGAVRCDRSSPRLVGCVFEDNAADSAGGAVFCLNAVPSVENCTLVGNAAPGGGGIFVETSSPTLANTIIAFGASGGAISCDSASAPALLCCNLFGNAGGDWVGCVAGQESLNGNLSADPHFCDLPGGDVGLYSHSPCANAPGCGRVGAMGVGCLREYVWNVPGDVPTIGAALDSAAVGDTVAIACGTYAESGLAMKSGVTLRSQTGTADCVIIDADGQNRVMTCTGADSTTVIRGITLTGGLATGMWPDNAGGGVYCENASPVFEACCFSKNTAGYGGAVAAKSASPAFRNCTFAGNAGSDGAGGIYSYYYGSSVSLDNCIISHSDQGEAVLCYYGGAATLGCSDVSGNAGGDWVGCIADQEETNGNLCADPVFCNPDSGDYRLAAESPCAPDHTPGECGPVGALGVGCTSTRVAEVESRLPRVLYLGPAVPNPFNPLTEITYGIPSTGRPSRVRMNVYDATGRHVSTLVDTNCHPGTHRAVWDGRDHRGAEVASGVYFYRLAWNGKSETRRMVLLK